MKDVAKTVNRIKILTDRYNKMNAGNKNTKSPGAKKKCLRQIKHFCHLVGARWYYQEDKLCVDFHDVTMEAATTEPLDVTISDPTREYPIVTTVAVVDDEPEVSVAEQMEADGVDDMGMLEIAPDTDTASPTPTEIYNDQITAPESKDTEEVSDSADEPADVVEEGIEENVTEEVEESTDVEPAPEEPATPADAEPVPTVEPETVQNVEADTATTVPEEPVGNFTSRF